MVLRFNKVKPIIKAFLNINKMKNKLILMYFHLKKIRKEIDNLIVLHNNINNFGMILIFKITNIIKKIDNINMQNKLIYKYIIFIM